MTTPERQALRAIRDLANATLGSDTPDPPPPTPVSGYQIRRYEPPEAEEKYRLHNTTQKAGAELVPTVIVTLDGVAAEGVDVMFLHGPVLKTARTNENGGAQVGIKYTGAHGLYAWIVGDAEAATRWDITPESGSGVVTPVPPPVDPPVTPEPPPTSGKEWTGADFPVRLLEGRSNLPDKEPMAFVLTPEGYKSQRFERPFVNSVCDLNVPRGVALKVWAEFESFAPGKQTTLKLKGLPRTSLSNVFFENWSSWEPDYAWGHEQTPRGGFEDSGDVRAYRIPAYVLTGEWQGIRGEDFGPVRSVVIAAMDHGAPAG